MQNTYKKWSQEDLRTLTNLRKKKVSYAHIAKLLDRSQASCHSKATALKYAEVKRSRSRGVSDKEITKLKNTVEVYKGKIAEMIKEKNILLKENTTIAEAALNYKVRFEEAEGVIKAFQLNIRNYEQRNQ